MSEWKKTLSTEDMSTSGPGSCSILAISSLLPLLTSLISRKVDLHLYSCFDLMIESILMMSKAHGI